MLCFFSFKACARKTDKRKIVAAQISRYQSAFFPGSVKDEIFDSDCENEQPFIANPFEAYKDSGCDSGMFVEGNHVKHSLSSCENPLGATDSEHLEERGNHGERKVKTEPLTPTGTPIKNLPFSPSQVGFNINLSQCMRFPTMWHFDKCRLGPASATSF